MKVSLLKLRNESKDYFDAHDQVKSFFWGDFLRHYADNQIKHAVIVASPMRASNISRKSVQVQLLVTYASRVFSDFSNLDEVHSDALDVLSDFVDAINYAPRWTDFVSGATAGNAEMFTQRTGDLVAGAAMFITLTIKNTVDLCAQPVSDYDFDLSPQPPQCLPATIVNSDGEFSVNVPSGSIYELPDTPVLVTDLGGNPLGSGDVPSVTGGTIEVNIQPFCDPATYTITRDNLPFDSGTIPSGGELEVNVPSVPCDPATFTLINTDETVLNSGTIPSGGSETITAPDATANVTIDGSPFQTVNIPSGGSATIDVPSLPRPSDWLPMPTVLPTEQTFVGLYAIFPSGNNFAAFRFNTSTGDYQVDWGDGTVTTHASNDIAEHTYDYATYDTGNTTLSTRGYKQAMIVVMPLTGNLTACNFQFRRTTTPAQNQAYATGFLDCILSMPNAISGVNLTFGGATVLHRYVERFDIKTIGDCNLLVNLFQNCNSLQSVPLFDTENVTIMQNMFTNCTSLQSVPLFDTENVTNINGMFSNCNSLQSVPLFNTENVNFMTNTFSSCNSLQSVPLFNTSSVTSMSGMFNGCVSLQTVPLFNTSSVQNFNQTFRVCASLNTIPNLNTSAATSMSDMFTFSSSFDRTDIICRVSVSFQNCQLSRDEIVNIFNNLLDRTSLASANINVSGNWGALALTAGDIAIATAKNWTVTT